MLKKIMIKEVDGSIITYATGIDEDEVYELIIELTEQYPTAVRIYCENDYN